ncbi:hypothetical protein [Streptomyces bohaiensis]|uniref:hypothetical protein n=1 Tax=Streptomyces bohaiensis TaxID=1431344 RepID=UPI003B76E063
MTVDGAVGGTVRYFGGPWDGEQTSMEDWTAADASTGAYVIVDGWGADRAAYEPEPGGDPWIWHYQGPVAA